MTFRCFRAVAAMAGVVVLLVLASCSGSGGSAGGNPKVTRENFDRIKKAMTTTEVKTILGDPDERENGPLVDGHETRFNIYRGTDGEEIRVQSRLLFTTSNKGVVIDKTFTSPDEP